MQLIYYYFTQELHGYVEQGLGSNLRARLSTALTLSMESTQREMTGDVPLSLYLSHLLPRVQPVTVPSRKDGAVVAGGTRTPDQKHRAAEGLRGPLPVKLRQSLRRLPGGRGLPVLVGPYDHDGQVHRT